MTRLHSILLLLIVAVIPPLEGQYGFPRYYEMSDFLPTAPGALKSGLYGFFNPATAAFQEQPDLMYLWNNAPASGPAARRWGLLLGAQNVGFGIVHNNVGGRDFSDYRLSLGGGSRAFAFGASLGWWSGQPYPGSRSTTTSLGVVVRPNPFVSLGLTGTSSFRNNENEAVVEAALRPLGSEFLTAFGDFSTTHGSMRTPAGTSVISMAIPRWSAGLAAEPVAGVRVIGRYFENKTATIGFEFSLSRLGVSTISNVDKDGKVAYNTYAIRAGAYDRNIVDTYFERRDATVELNLSRTIDYRRYALFDPTLTLSSLLRSIDAARTDPRVSGIAINTSGMTVDREKLWEIREKLKEFRSAGKRVIVYVDRGGIDLCHFASVADKIVMDPAGMLSLEGYIFGRTYYKGTLEKVGIGFDELRFFKYKSANEAFAREKMSDADREQLQALVDEYYEEARSEICDGRHLAPATFDSLVNHEMVFLPERAVQVGLVDTIGRWETVEDIAIRDIGPMINPGRLLAFNLPHDNRWGEPPRIAIIYALGVCAMDQGITARRLVTDVNAAVNDPGVKGIVLRVDSPGGDALASDYIAEALRKAKGKKPIIVSQGYVAASGGYWLSMYGDTIVAAPTTISGSIGVIGGLFYNKSLKESLGFSTDFVKRGDHADLGAGFSLPLIGLGLPDRDMTPDERAHAEGWIKALYTDFVHKVSTGRHMSEASVDSVAQGRVWSGADAQRVGLVDELGGLDCAVDIAKEKAGIEPGAEVALVEMPKKGLFDFGMFMPRLFGFEGTIATDPFIEQVKFRLLFNGQPMPILPLEDMPALTYR